MKASETLDKAREAMSVKRVFGEPVEKDGITVIPVAKIQGGGGGGGDDKAGGAGFGLNTRPAGVFVIKEGKVSWQPALDLNRVILGGQLVGVVALLTIRAFARRRKRL